MNIIVDTETLLKGLLNEDVSKEDKEEIEVYITDRLNKVAIDSSIMVTILENLDKLLAVDTDLLAVTEPYTPIFKFLEKQSYKLYKDYVLLGKDSSSEYVKNLSDQKYTEDLLQSLDTVKWDGHVLKVLNLEGGSNTPVETFEENPQKHIKVLTKGIVILNKILIHDYTVNITEDIKTKLNKYLDTDKLVSRYLSYLEPIIEELKTKEEDLFLLDENLPREYYFEDKMVLQPDYFFDKKELILEVLTPEEYSYYAEKFITNKEQLQELSQILNQEKSELDDDEDDAEDTEDGVLSWGL